MRRGWLLTPVLFVTGSVFLYEAFFLLGAGHRIVVKDAVYRVTIGVDNPWASRAFGAVFLLAALAVLVALTGRQAGSLWWKTLTLGAWGVVMAIIIVMLGCEMWFLGRATVEPTFVYCGTFLLLGRQVDYFYHVALLVWLGLSGLWIGVSSRSVAPNAMVSRGGNGVRLP